MNATQTPLMKPATRPSAAAPASSACFRSVSLLIPSSALPAEGAEIDLASGLLFGSDLRQSLDAFRALSGDAAPRFEVSKTDADLITDIDGASSLHWARLEAATDAGASLEVSPATTDIDWSSALARVNERIADESFMATQQELSRVFLEETRAAVSSAARGFAGEAVPVVSINSADGESITVTFHGVWLADVGAQPTLSGPLPVRSLRADDGGALDGCLVLNESEVEGRGIVEAVMSVSMLAMVFQQPVKPAMPEAETKKPGAIAQLVSFSRQDDIMKSEELLVKSQKLKQPAPQVYPNVIKGAQGCEYKVIVDIGGQRAYVFIDQQLAFETPISSASKGRHTPRGTFTITEKIRSGKRSTIYKSLMPYWMRLDQSAIGMHTGQLPGYPASHGCMRMPDESARFIFDLVPKGTKVHVMDHFTPQPAAPTLVASK